MNQNTGKLIMDKVMGLPIIVFFTLLFFPLMAIFMLGYVIFRTGKNPYTHKSCGMHKSCFLQQTKPQQQTTPTLTNKQVVLSIQQLISIIEQTEALFLMVKEFADCIKENRPALTDGEAGLQVLRILEAAERSINADGANVRIEYSGGDINGILSH